MKNITSAQCNGEQSGAAGAIYNGVENCLIRDNYIGELNT